MKKLKGRSSFSSGKCKDHPSTIGSFISLRLVINF
jgi:hypothetical protein